MGHLLRTHYSFSVGRKSKVSTTRASTLIREARMNNCENISGYVTSYYGDREFFHKSLTLGVEAGARAQINNTNTHFLADCLIPCTNSTVPSWYNYDDNHHFVECNRLCSHRKLNKLSRPTVVTSQNEQLPC